MHICKYVCMYTFIWQCTYVAVFLSALFSRSCCSHFYCITSLNLNRAEPSFRSHGCSPGSLWHLAALRGWVSATCKHSQTKYTHTHIQTHTYRQHTGEQDTHAADPSPAAAANFSHVFLFLSLSLSSSRRGSAQRRRRRRQRSRRQQQRLRRSPVSLSISAVLGIESATSEQRTTFQSQRQKTEEQQTAAEISVEPVTKKETGVKNVWSKPSGERGEPTNERTELKCNLLQ